MSERGGGGGGGGTGGIASSRHARVSPTPGRGSKVAYTLCPRTEPAQDMSRRNCLAIPMSTLPTPNGQNSKVGLQNTCSKVLFNWRTVSENMEQRITNYEQMNSLREHFRQLLYWLKILHYHQQPPPEHHHQRDHHQSESILDYNHMKRCSALSGIPSTPVSTTATSFALPSIPHEVETPQPLVDRKASVSFMRWNGNHINNNFNNNNNNANNNDNYQSRFLIQQQQQQQLQQSQYQQQQQQQQQQQFHQYPATATATAMAATKSLILSKQFPNATTIALNAAAASQVNFNNGGNVGLARSEPISLATLDRDCFIIPVHSVDRFLPAGIPLPAINADGKTTSPLGVLEVSDPKLCILVHLMSPLEPIDPIMESPLSHPILKQRNIAADLLSEVQQANTAVGGMLLANMEKTSEFPFISYYLINTMQTDPTNFYANLRVSSLSKFEPKALNFSCAHTLDLYSEVISICRPPLVLPTTEAGSFKKTQTAATAYIISVFKVFEGDDGERFEKNWLYWTGARMLYRYLPRAAGLRRIALHKSTAQKGDKMYLLVCECADLLKDISLAAFLIPALRARLCGYTGLYRPIQAF